MPEPTPVIDLGRPIKRRLRIGVRAMLGVIATFGLWLGIHVNAAHRQKSAISAITSVGGYYYYDFQYVDGVYTQDKHPPGPGWLWNRVDLDYCRNVTAVGLNSKPATDEMLERIAGLRRLKMLDLCGSKITDNGLESLRGLADLEYLRLDDTATTDAGLINLQGLTRLRELLVDGERVTNEGVVRLNQSLPQLKCERVE